MGFARKFAPAAVEHILLHTAFQILDLLSIPSFMYTFYTQELVDKTGSFNKINIHSYYCYQQQNHQRQKKKAKNKKQQMLTKH